MKTMILTLLGVILAASAATAAPGDPCDPSDFVPVPYRSDKDKINVWCIYLVQDESSEASAVPTVVNISERGIPTLAAVQIGSTNPCTAGTISVRTSVISGGLEVDIGNPQPTFDLSGVGTVSYGVQPLKDPVGVFWSVTWADVACSGGGFDLLLIGYQL